MPSLLAPPLPPMALSPLAVTTFCTSVGEALPVALSAAADVVEVDALVSAVSDPLSAFAVPLTPNDEPPTTRAERLRPSALPDVGVDVWFNDALLAPSAEPVASGRCTLCSWSAPRSMLKLFALALPLVACSVWLSVAVLLPRLDPEVAETAPVVASARPLPPCIAPL